MANSVDPDQTDPKGAVCSGYTVFASILNWLVMLGNYLKQTTSADDIFRCFFLGDLRVNRVLVVCVLCLFLRCRWFVSVCSTVNSEIFTRILFSRIALKDTFAT